MKKKTGTKLERTTRYQFMVGWFLKCLNVLILQGVESRVSVLKECRPLRAFISDIDSGKQDERTGKSRCNTWFEANTTTDFGPINDLRNDVIQHATTSFPTIPRPTSMNIQVDWSGGPLIRNRSTDPVSTSVVELILDELTLVLLEWENEHN